MQISFKLISNISLNKLSVYIWIHDSKVWITVTPLPIGSINPAAAPSARMANNIRDRAIAFCFSTPRAVFCDGFAAATVVAKNSTHWITLQVKSFMYACVVCESAAKNISKLKVFVRLSVTHLTSEWLFYRAQSRKVTMCREKHVCVVVLRQF